MTAGPVGTVYYPQDLSHQQPGQLRDNGVMFNGYAPAPVGYTQTPQFNTYQPCHVYPTHEAFVAQQRDWGAYMEPTGLEGVNTGGGNNIWFRREGMSAF